MFKITLMGIGKGRVTRDFHTAVGIRIDAEAEAVKACGEITGNQDLTIKRDGDEGYLVFDGGTLVGCFNITKVD